MYTVKIRRSLMIAHSLKHPFFGPAQGLHGATYVADIEFFTSELDEHNVVIDIGFAHKAAEKIIGKLAYQNLDELPQFEGKLTTTEFLARYLHDQIKEEVQAVFDGSIKVELGETHDAWASYSS